MRAREPISRVTPCLAPTSTRPVPGARASTPSLVRLFATLALWPCLTQACAQTDTAVSAEADAGPADIAGGLLDVDAADLTETTVCDAVVTDTPAPEDANDGGATQQDSSPSQDAGLTPVDVWLGCPTPKLDPACLPGTPTLCSAQIGPTWDQLGGNRANTGMFPVPVRAKLKLDWKVKIGGANFSSPVAVGRHGHVHVPYRRQTLLAPGIPTFGGFRTLAWNGAKLWTSLPTHKCLGSVAIAGDGAVYTLCYGGLLYKYAADGALLWTAPAGYSMGWPSPPRIGADGAVRLASGDGVVSVSPKGKINWQHEELWTTARTFAMDSNDSLYVHVHTGFVARVDANGSVAWQTRPGPFSEANGWCAGPVVVQDAFVVVASKIWSQRASWKGMEIGLLSSKDGAVLWTRKLKDEQVTDALAADPQGRIFVGTETGWLHAFSVSGAPLWKKKLDGVIRSPAIGCNGWMLVTTSALILYRVSTKGDTAPVKLWSWTLSDGQNPALGKNVWGTLGRVSLGREGRAYVVLADAYADTEYLYALRFVDP